MQQFHRHVLASIDALRQIALPRLIAVDPAGNGIQIAAQARLAGKLPRQRSLPSEHHVNVLPARVIALVLKQQPRDHMVVSIGKDVRLHIDEIADNPLDREAPGVDLGLEFPQPPPACIRVKASPFLAFPLSGLSARCLKAQSSNFENTLFSASDQVGCDQVASRRAV